MKLIISLSDLKKALKDVSYVVPSNPIVPILENVVLEISENKATLTACDIMNTIKSWFNVSGQPNCKILFPFRIIQTLLNKINSPEIEMVITDGKMQIKTGKSIAKISMEDVTDWPEVPVINDAQNKMIIGSQSLITMIEKTEYAISTDELRPSMTQINLIIDQDKVKARSTDSHKAAIFECDVEAKESFEMNAGQHITKCKSLFQEDQPLIITSDDSRYKVEGDRASFESRKIEERFPDIDNVIPNEKDCHRSTFDRSQMIAELDRCIMFSDKNTKSVKLTFKKNKIEISSRDIDFDNEYSGEVEADVLGEELEIGVNGFYMKEMLSRFEDEEVILFHQGEPNRSILLKEDSYTTLLMPVML